MSNGFLQFDYQIERTLSEVWDVEAIRSIPNYDPDREVEEISPPIQTEGFDKAFRDPLKPAVIRGAVTHWAAYERWSDPAYLSEQAGDRPVRVTEGLPLDYLLEYFTERQFLPGTSRDRPFYREMPLDRYLAIVTSDLRDDKFLYLRSFPLTELETLCDEVGSLPFLRAEQRGTKTFFAGKYTYSDIHEHMGRDAVACQVTGSKEFILYPPDALHARALYPIRIVSWSPVRLFDLDLDRFPEFERAVPYRVVLEPGDALYIPNPWWHAAVSSEEFSCTVTHWFEPKTISFEHPPSRWEMWRSPLSAYEVYQSDTTQDPRWRECIKKPILSLFG